MKLVCRCGAEADGTHALWVRGGTSSPFYESTVRIWTLNGEIIGTELVTNSQTAVCIVCYISNIEKKYQEQEAAAAARKAAKEEEKKKNPKKRWFF